MEPGWSLNLTGKNEVYLRRKFYKKSMDKRRMVKINMKKSSNTELSTLFNETDIPG